MDSRNHFGRVPIILCRSNSYWSGSGLPKIFLDLQKDKALIANAKRQSLCFITFLPNFCHFNTDQVEQDFIREKKSAFREFEDQKVYLKDQLIAELEEKQKLIETERHNMELTGDSMELKPITTRKLRRRANEPSGE